MARTTERLTKLGLITPPNFVVSNTMYEVVMGSFAYGVSSDTSDYDLYGWCIPPVNVIFPHLDGEILGFDSQPRRFEQYQKHHVLDADALGGRGRNYDITVYNIVKYFKLIMQNNPNMIDSLFVPQNCILHCTQVGQMVRERRQMFLHRGCWHRFKGYAFSMLKKAKIKNHRGLKEVVRFEDEYSVDRGTTLSDIEKELQKRGLKVA
jgi:predicted nucleotidyltransferase